MPDPQNPLLLNRFQLQTSILMAVNKPPVFTPVLVNAVLVEPVAIATLAQPTPAVTVVPGLQNMTLAPPVRQALLVRNKLVMSQIGETKFVNPSLGRALAGIVPQTSGLPRERIKVPISPRPNVTDEQLFEGSVDAADRFFLPRYRIQTEVVSGQNQVRLALEKDGDGGKLTVFLEKFPASALAEASRTAQELPHSVNVLLRFTIGNAQKELEFQERSATLNQAVLRVSDSAQLTQLYHALSETTYNTVLIIRRLFTVALPVEPTPTRPIGPFPRPLPFFGPGPRFAESSQLNELQQDAPVAPSVFARINPALATRMNVRTGSDRPIVRDHRVPNNTSPPAVSVPPTPPVQLYRATSRTLDVTIPMGFPVALFPSVYQGIIPSANPVGPGLIAHQFTFEGRAHRYFQDTADRNTVYYLPDSFRLARRPRSPRFPFMSVGFTSPDGGLTTTRVTVRYAAAPFVRAERIVDAVTQMKPFLSNPVDSAVLKPMLSSKTRLRLSLPGGVGGLMQERAGARIDLQQGLTDELSLSVADFQGIYDALFSNASVLFQGDVLVDVGFGAAESIPFSARMDDLLGEVFDYTAIPDAVAGVVNVSLQNVTESPVSIKTLAATLLVDNTEQAATLTQFTPPARISPGEVVTFGVVPVAPIPNGGIAGAGLLFDLTTDAHPDPATVWEAILDPAAPAEYQKKITVQTVRAFFDPPAGQPDHQLIAIVVDIEGGTSVVLTTDPDHLREETVAPLSLREVILKTADDGTLHYRVRLIRKDGTGLMGQPRSFTGGTVLFLTNAELPKADLP